MPRPDLVKEAETKLARETESEMETERARTRTRRASRPETERFDGQQRTKGQSANELLEVLRGEGAVVKHLR